MCTRNIIDIRKINLIMRKKALIFGVTGQDGSYMCKHLIKKNYVVHGICRRKNYVNLKKLSLLKKVKLHLISNTNKIKILKVLRKNFDEIYFLGGQSSVQDSFKNEQKTYESQINPLKVILNLFVLEIKCKFIFFNRPNFFKFT